MNTHDTMKLMPEVLAALKASGQNVSLAQDLEAAIEADRQRRGEPVAWPKTAAEIRDFIDVNYISMAGGDDPSDDDKYTLTVHDLLSAFRWWTSFAPQPAAPAVKDSLTVADKHPPEVQAAWHSGWEAGQDALRESMAAGAADG